MLHKQDVIDYYDEQIREVNPEGLPDTASDKVHATRMAELEERLGAEICQAIAWVANWNVNGE